MANSDELMSEEGRKILEEVEKEDGKPVIVSRYGFRAVELDSKKVLVATTLEELAAQLAKLQGKDIETIKREIDFGPQCGGRGPFNCFPYNRCTSCTYEYIGNGYYRCVCTSSN
jgi:hypothetical protein